jgi:hypothetical protein
MTDFLSLCALLTRRSGCIGAAPASVVGQTGRQARCVDWVLHAWEQVQQIHPRDWTFLQGEWSSTLNATNDTYAPVTLGIASRFGSWKGDRLNPRGRLIRPVTIYDPAKGVADEGPLTELSYENFRERYDRGSQSPSRPVHYAIAPDQTLRFGPVPDMDFTVRGEYLKAPQILADNADEPDMPAQFHDIIVDQAIIIMDEADESPAGLASAIRGFSYKLAGMRNLLLPQLVMPGGG